MKNILFVYSIITSCIITHPSQTVKQGLAGNVYVKSGNHIPSPGRKPDEGKPVSRTIFIYELTQREQATDNGGHFTNIKTKLIAKGQSNNAGHYVIALAPGRYSVFVEDNNQLYANSFDGKGNINPVEVKKDSISKLDVIISSMAVY